MRILINDPAYADDLVAYLRRCGCAADVVGRGVVDATPPHAELEQSYLRMELDAYLRVWTAMAGVQHPRPYSRAYQRPLTNESILNVLPKNAGNGARKKKGGK